MKTNDGVGGAALLKALPALTIRFCELASRSQGPDRAGELFELAVTRPEYLTELTRGMGGSSDYAYKAAVASGLLMAMTAQGNAAGSNYALFKPVTEIAQGFNRLFLPLATQKPDYALEIVSAGLAEPEMSVFVRDRLALSFTDAGFSLLRSRPAATLTLLQVLGRQAQEGGAQYLSRDARNEAANDLLRAIDLYPPRLYPDDARRSIDGKSVSLAGPVALEATEIAAKLADDSTLSASAQARAATLRKALDRLAVVS